MAKSLLHLSIDTDLLSLAKQSNLNLSSEFESWIKIRINQMDNMNESENSNLDIDREMLRLRNELTRLQNEKERQASEEMKQKELNGFLDYNLEIINKNKKENQTLEEKITERVNGLKYLYKNKYHKLLTDTKIIKLFVDRAKEKGLLNSDE